MQRALKACQCLRRCVLICIVSAWGDKASSAEPYTETFSASSNEWSWVQGLNTHWSGSFTNDMARVSVNPISGFPSISKNVVLSSSTNTLPFSGNYTDAGIELIGFKFFAESRPSDGDYPLPLYLQWGNESNTFETLFAVAETGRWYSFEAALRPEYASQWVDLSGNNLEYFASTLRAVEFVRLTFNGASTTLSPGAPSHIYYIDDIYIDRMPVLSSRPGINANTLEVSASRLRTNESYVIESSTNLVTQIWQQLGSFAATSSSSVTNYPSTNDALFLRIRID